MNLWNMKARDLGQAIATRKISAVELMQSLLSRIDRWEDQIHAFTYLDRADALAQARASDEDLRRNGPRGALHGIPVALKDMIDVTGVPTTFNSRLLLDNVASDDAECVKRLREAGAIIFGKLATHEFALGGPSFDGAFAPARNPWDTRLHPGGSSSGAGAGLAAGFFPLAVGTDSGGSIRSPAAACGIVGMKPTYGAVSTRGVLPLAPTVDCVGPMTRNVGDAALLFDVLKDPSKPGAGLAACKSLADIRIGYVKAFEDDTCDPEIQKSLLDVASRLTDAGARIERVDAPPLPAMRGINQLIMSYECWAIYGERVKAHAGALSQTSRRRMLAGAFLNEHDYNAALDAKERVTRFVDNQFATYDFLFCANSMALPCAIDDPVQLRETMPRQARAPFSLTGHPAIALCGGFASNGLPISFQLVGAHHEDHRLLTFAGMVEEHLAVAPRWPEPANHSQEPQQ